MNPIPVRFYKENNSTYLKFTTLTDRRVFRRVYCVNAEFSTTFPKASYFRRAFDILIDRDWVVLYAVDKDKNRGYIKVYHSSLVSALNLNYYYYKCKPDYNYTKKVSNELPKINQKILDKKRITEIDKSLNLIKNLRLKAQNEFKQIRKERAKFKNSAKKLKRKNMTLAEINKISNLEQVESYKYKTTKVSFKNRVDRLNCTESELKAEKLKLQYKPVPLYNAK